MAHFASANRRVIPHGCLLPSSPCRHLPSPWSYVATSARTAKASGTGVEDPCLAFYQKPSCVVWHCRVEAWLLFMHASFVLVRPHGASLIPHTGVLCAKEHPIVARLAPFVSSCCERFGVFRLPLFPRPHQLVISELACHASHCNYD